MKRIKKPVKALPNVSPFLTLELKSDQSDGKSNDISDHPNGLEPDDPSCAEKGGSRPFLGTIRGFSDELSLQNNPLKQLPYIALNYCSSTLLQQHRFQSSANRYQTTVTELSNCSSKLYQQTVEPDDSDDLAHDGAGSSSKPVESVPIAMDSDLVGGSEDRLCAGHFERLDQEDRGRYWQARQRPD